MNYFLVLVCCLPFIAGTVGQFQCSAGSDATGFPKSVCYVESCTNLIKNHIAEELKAAFSYLYLAARFDDVNVNRPGIAKFLYESASEERSHAIMMLEYLGQRGIPFDNDFAFDLTTIESGDTLMKLVEEHTGKNVTYKAALETALKMEITVTQMIYNVVEGCNSDFHGADFFTDPILAEQHEGIRKLQGSIKSFEDLLRGHGDSAHEMKLVEYIFDNQMLSGSA